MNLDFDKLGGLLPAIIQDNATGKVLMLGFMNETAYKKTVEIGKVTFYSRTRQCLWTKGETSGNFLNVVSMRVDCDNDTLLIKVNPVGPVCHTGADTCWDEENKADFSSLQFVEEAVLNSGKQCPKDSALAVKSAQLVDLMRSLSAEGLSLKDVISFLASQYGTK